MVGADVILALERVEQSVHVVRIKVRRGVVIFRRKAPPIAS
ncbi:hypothetical protein JDO7802_03486 [Jannaschia donghaensis]|uniref:Uncharacterized protein n=1 Tax=Jannaschia donghaensis TaxID=420998 RepID=A0A0M6YR23_9RHOB|nr:hypothetical protein JDO7802_03486 [Jannaschia donghaensis]